MGSWTGICLLTKIHCTLSVLQRSILHDAPDGSVHRLQFFRSGGDGMRFGMRALIMVAVLAVTSTAQTFRGAIHGSVEDPSGGMVANAQVKATDTATGVEHTTVTTSGG